MGGTDTDRNVFLVDDDEVMCELLTALMTVEGYSVAYSHSAQAAMQHLQHMADAPGVILCDLRMPGVHRGELARALAAARAEGTLPATTVLLGMSGSAPDGAEAEDFDGFLRKPFTVGEFTELVSEIQKGGKGSFANAPPHGATDGSTRPPLEERTFQQLRSKLGGSLRELYQMTLDDVQERLRRMTAAAEEGDSATVRREAHTIKGSCGMVGALELQALAAATEGGSPFDTAALVNFNAACQRLRRMLDEKL